MKSVAHFYFYFFFIFFIFFFKCFPVTFSDSDSDSSTSSGHSTIYLSSDEGDSSSEDLDNKKVNVNSNLVKGSADFELKDVKTEDEEGMKSRIVPDEHHVNTGEPRAGTEEPDKKHMKVEIEIEAGKKEAEIYSTCSENKDKIKDDTKPVKAFAKKSTGQNADTNLMFLSKHRKTSGGKSFTSRLPKGTSLIFSIVLVAPAVMFCFS